MTSHGKANYVIYLYRFGIATASYRLTIDCKLLLLIDILTNNDIFTIILIYPIYFGQQSMTKMYTYLERKNIIYLHRHSSNIYDL